MKDINLIKVPVLNENLQECIAVKIRLSNDKNRLSKFLYQQATQILEQELGLDKLEFKKEKSYRASFSEIFAFNRSDAEYFNVRFNPLLVKIYDYKGGTSKLSSISNRVFPNFNKTNCSVSSIYYIEIGDINVADGSFSFKEIETINAPENAKIRINGNELALSMVRPTRGAITLIPIDLPSGITIVSGAFYVCEIRNELHREIIWLYLRIIKNLFEKYCTGTSYPTIEPVYFSSFPVPNFDDKLALQIRDIITESNICRKQSKQLLEQAKTEVETLIEQAVN